MLTILFDLRVEGILCPGIDGMSLVHLDVTLDVRCHKLVNAIESLLLASRSSNDVTRKALKFVKIIYCCTKMLFLESGL